jgi:hypothetical protein
MATGVGAICQCLVGRVCENFFKLPALLFSHLTEQFDSGGTVISNICISNFHGAAQALKGRANAGAPKPSCRQHRKRSR